MWKCTKCGREFSKNNQSHYCGEKPKTIEEYILSQDEDKQSDLWQVHYAIKKAIPDAQESIKWSMPCYGKALINFAASKNHIGFYPGEAAVAEFKDELSEYNPEKGNIRIPYGKVDGELIVRIVKWCKEKA